MHYSIRSGFGKVFRRTVVFPERLFPGGQRTETEGNGFPISPLPLPAGLEISGTNVRSNLQPVDSNNRTSLSSRLIVRSLFCRFSYVIPLLHSKYKRNNTVCTEGLQ
jgi:hypothetical protein